MSVRHAGHPLRVLYPELLAQLLHCRGCLPRAKCRGAQMHLGYRFTRSRYASVLSLTVDTSI